MKNLLSVFLLAFLVTEGIDAQEGDKGDKKSNEILDRLTKKTESYTTIRVEFVYKMVNVESGIDEKTEGELLVMGNKYRLHIAGQTVISDGSTIWTYIADADEVHINSHEESDESISPGKLLSSYNKDYRSKFIKEEVQYGATVNVLDLTPVQGKSYYKVRLVVDRDKDQLHEITIFDKNGSTYSYIINKFEPNKAIPESTFTFSKAEFPGAEIIDMR